MPLSQVTLQIGSRRIRADVASTPQSRVHGMMHRLSLEEDCGMIFVFDDDQPRSFWMKETYLPLSIAYLSENGTIINIEKMTPFDLTGVQSQAPARYALEMNEGWFEKNGIRPGDTIDLPNSLGERGLHMSESKLRLWIRSILRENFVSHSDEPGVGDRVVNNNPKCKHYGSKGIVLSIDSLDDDMGKTVSYKCTNDGEHWSRGDKLKKTMDQMTRLK